MLYRNPATRKLLRHLSGASAGKLMSECCCTPPTNGCGSCSPSLPYTYTVTLDGLGGDLEWANGAHLLVNDGTPYSGSYEPGCYWHKEVIRSEYRVGSVTWYMRLIANTNDPHDWILTIRMQTAACFVQFRLDDVADICDGAAGSYTKTDCDDQGCPYRRFYECGGTGEPTCACDASTGATAVVS